MSKRTSKQTFGSQRYPEGRGQSGRWEGRDPHRISVCQRRSSSSCFLASCFCFLFLSSRSFQALLLSLMEIGRSGLTFFWKRKKGLWDQRPSLRREHRGVSGTQIGLVTVTLLLYLDNSGFQPPRVLTLLVPKSTGRKETGMGDRTTDMQNNRHNSESRTLSLYLTEEPEAR